MSARALESTGIVAPIARVAYPSGASADGPHRRASDLPAASRAVDAQSLDWVDALSDVGHRHDDAVERLHALLLQGAIYELARRARVLGSGRRADRDDLAMQAADDALIAILKKLPGYRGASRFTTWANRFVVLEVAVKSRRATWQSREVALEDAGWARLADHRASPETKVQTAELLSAVSRAISQALTPYQKAVVTAIVLNSVPVDVLAKRLATTRGALYKTLHDARRKLRADLAGQGLTPDDLSEPKAAQNDTNHLTELRLAA